MQSAEITKYEGIYSKIIAEGKPKKNATHRLLARLEKYNIETLSFMYDFDIPFDNNLALSSSLGNPHYSLEMRYRNVA